MVQSIEILLDGNIMVCGTEDGISILIMYDFQGKELSKVYEVGQPTDIVEVIVGETNCMALSYRSV